MSRGGITSSMPPWGDPTAALPTHTTIMAMHANSSPEREEPLSMRMQGLLARLLVDLADGWELDPTEAEPR